MRIYNASIVASYIIYHESVCGRYVSNLRLQKLLYFVQARFLFSTDEPCFVDKIYAWDFGPVVPWVYNKYIGNGGCLIPATAEDREAVDIIDPEAQLLIDETLEQAADYSTTDLLHITHNQTPWIKAHARGDKSVISNKSIKKFFKE